MSLLKHARAKRWKIVFLLALLSALNLNAGGDDEATLLKKFWQKQVRDVQGKPIHFQKGAVWLLLFFDPLIPTQKLIAAYGQILADHYEPKGLKVAFITPSHAPDSIRDYFRTPLIEDTDNSLHDIFNLPKCCGGTVLLNRNKNVILFNASPMISAHSLRQLVEKELTGQIDYSNKKPSLIPPRDITAACKDLEMISLSDYKKRRVTDFKEDKLVVTFFSSFCSTCSTGKRIAALQTLREEIKKCKKSVRFLVVFFRPIDEDDIAVWESGIKLSEFELYSAQDFLPPSIRYYTGSGSFPDAVTVVLDSNRKAAFVNNSADDENSIIGKIIAEIRGV